MFSLHFFYVYRYLISNKVGELLVPWAIYLLFCDLLIPFWLSNISLFIVNFTKIYAFWASNFSCLSSDLIKTIKRVLSLRICGNRILMVLKIICVLRSWLKCIKRIHYIISLFIRVRLSFLVVIFWKPLLRKRGSLSISII